MLSKMVAELDLVAQADQTKGERSIGEVDTEHEDEEPGGEPRPTLAAVPDLPPDLYCPMSRNAFYDPVILVETGHTYERCFRT